MQRKDERTPHQDAQTTLNKMGWESKIPSVYGEAFIQFASTSDGPVLDIGAAFGAVAISALTAGGTVIANDIEIRHLQVLQARVPTPHLQRLTLLPGKFPGELQFEENSLCGIHASRVLHFLQGTELVTGAKLMYEWMRPGGKLFILAGTPYQGTFRPFIPVYLERKRQGVRWPGEIQNVRDYSDHPSAELLPSFVHWLDDEILVSLVEDAGFVVEEVRLHSRLNLPDFCKFDGRENVGLIAKKQPD